MRDLLEYYVIQDVEPVKHALMKNLGLFHDMGINLLKENIT